MEDGKDGRQIYEENVETNNGVWEMEVTINRNRKQRRVDNVRRNDTEVAGSNKKANVNVKKNKQKRKKRTRKENGKNKIDKVKIKWHKSGREQQTIRCKCEEKRQVAGRQRKKNIICAEFTSTEPAYIIKTQHTVLSSRHKNRKTGRNQTKMSPATTTAAITSHYSPPIKSFTACLGGERVAEMIHHCSVSHITDRPSPRHCSSESQINRPDTSNDSAWKRRHGLQTQIHICTLDKKKKTSHIPHDCHKQSY